MFLHHPPLLAHVDQSAPARRRAGSPALRITSAMAAGLSKTVMDWAQIVEAMDADTPAPKRGSYRKRRAA